MKLIVGGVGQGKLAYVLSKTGLSEGDVTCALEGKPVVNEVQDIVRDLLDRGEDPVEALLAFVRSHPQAILICDEVGCGVVPVAPEERAWREAVGRTCCALAREAGRVERIFCGLALTLKEEEGWN